MSREGFVARRLRQREREAGLVIRGYLERGVRPPRRLWDEHRALWVARSHAIAADWEARRDQ